MPRRKLTKDYLDAMLQGFREAPGNARHAARTAKCTPKTARKAWNRGVPHCHWPEYHRPFAEIIAEEQMEARAKLQEAKETGQVQASAAEMQRAMEARAKALTDATENRVTEGKMVRAARNATLTTLAAVAQCSAGVAKVGAMVRKALEQLVVEDGAGVVCVVADPVQYAVAQDPVHLRALSIGEARSFTKTLASLGTALRQVNDAAQKSMEMERLLLGEPTSIVEHRHLENVSIEEAERRIAAAARAVAMLKEEGISTLDGSAAGLDPTLN